MNNTLIISDTHFPYEHPDTFDFLEALAWSYDIKEVKHTGDMVDNHTGSFHEIEYGTLSPKEEHEQAKEKVQRLYKMFPDMNVIIGNHGSMSYRKAKVAGIPEDHLKSYNDMYGVNWNWMDRDKFKVKGTNCLLIHSMGANTLSNARNHSHHSIQGHHHSRFGIEYFGDTDVIRWSMTVGCLINPHSPAFNYASKATLNRPIIGCGGIIDDEPRLFIMQLDKNGRWVGEL
jgi:predicted phosphodiesterase